MIENAHKDKHCKKYDRNFQIRVQLSKIDKYLMEEQELPRMPRKIKKSKAQKESEKNSKKPSKSKSKSKSKSRSKSPDRKKEKKKEKKKSKNKDESD